MYKYKWFLLIMVVLLIGGCSSQEPIPKEFVKIENKIEDSNVIVNVSNITKKSLLKVKVTVYSATMPGVINVNAIDPRDIIEIREIVNFQPKAVEIIKFKKSQINKNDLRIYIKGFYGKESKYTQYVLDSPIIIEENMLIK